jgi:SAM-dependent methyltransferase
MVAADPSLFYTGLVADAYAPLRSTVPDPEPYERFVRRYGEPALELGCGTGDPLLALRAAGLDVVGLDSSADMLERCRAAALARGIEVELVHQTMQAMNLDRRFRSIYLAGPTFQLLVEPDACHRALVAIGRHLEPDGRALVPLFVPEPEPPDAIGRWREHTASDGSVLRVAVLHDDHRVDERLQHRLLRYERVVDGDLVDSVEQVWSLRWFAPGEFAELVAQAALEVDVVLAEGGHPTSPDSPAGAFVLRHP